MKLVGPAVLGARDPRQRIARVDEDEIVLRNGGEPLHRRIEAVDDRGDDVQAFGRIIARELERGQKPGTGADRRRSVRDGVVIAMSDNRLSRSDGVAQGEEVHV